MTLGEIIVKFVSAEDESDNWKYNDPTIANGDVVIHCSAPVDVTAESFAFIKSEVCGYPDTVFHMLLLRCVECCVTGCNDAS